MKPYFKFLCLLFKNQVKELKNKVSLNFISKKITRYKKFNLTRYIASVGTPEIQGVGVGLHIGVGLYLYLHHTPFF
jgi:hypothetical protein